MATTTERLQVLIGQLIVTNTLQAEQIEKLEEELKQLKELRQLRVAADASKA